MPRRRTQDVIHVVMTDHRIQRRPPAGDLLAPLAEQLPEITGVEFLNPAEAPEGALGEAYRAVTVLRTMPRTAPAARQLEQSIQATKSPVPRFDLIAAFLQQRQFGRALEMLHRLGDSIVGDARLRDWRGMAEAGVGKTDESLADLRAAAAAAPDVPEMQFNLATILHRTGHDAEALPFLTRAVELRPNFVAAWIMRGETLAGLGKRNDAIADARQALAVDPRETRGYLLLARLLKETGNNAEASRWLRHGARVAARPEEVKALTGE